MELGLGPRGDGVGGRLPVGGGAGLDGAGGGPGGFPKGLLWARLVLGPGAGVGRVQGGGGRSGALMAVERKLEWGVLAQAEIIVT
ncbi:hypothetical protein E0489_00095 [Thermus tengchongensis]|uniref:Uncharacterized protein n=1 Tax=Thermus tengchongensis TaxID=1214928 RepID=A0ABY2KB35_9DEIN|nr:hypothetical protein E0489_00095 [Thermus tengchongensis]